MEFIGVWNVKKNSSSNRNSYKWELNSKDQFYQFKHPNTIDTSTVNRAGHWEIYNDTIKFSTWKSEHKHTLLNQFPKLQELEFIYIIEGDKLVLFDPKKTSKPKYFLKRSN